MMENLDINALKANLDSINSAFAASLVAKQNEDAYRIARAVSEQNARRDSIMMEGARANIEQRDLLEQQLEAVKTQNSLLEKQIGEMQERNALLNDLYENSKKEAADNAKEARHNKIFGWVSFGIGILIGISGIVFGIVF